MRAIEVLSYEEAGFKPVMHYGAWRVALFNACDSCTPERITRLQKHNESDEIFVLLDGSCTLILSDEEVPQRVYGVKLQPHKVYNVRHGRWHNHVLAPDARVLVVENDDVTLENSPFTPMPYPLDMDTLEYPPELN